MEPYTIIADNVNIVFPTTSILGSLRRWNPTGELYAETRSGYRYQVASYEIWEEHDTGIVQTKRDWKGLPIEF